MMYGLREEELVSKRSNRKSTIVISECDVALDVVSVLVPLSVS